MKKISLVALIGFLILLVGFTYRYFNPPVKAPAINSNGQPLPTVANRETNVSYVVETVATGLSVPWSIVFTDPNRILIAERIGQIREIRDNQLTPKPLLTFPDLSATEESGLMGLTKDPDYDSNRYLYATYSYKSANNTFVKIVRLLDQQSSIKVDTIIFNNIPAAQFHAGTRLAFGPDKKLYVSTGDGTKKSAAQDPSSVGGKILRLNTDGTIPSDNPTPGSAIYATGLRNSQGLAWDRLGNFYAVDHGPTAFDGPPGGDEVNRIVANGNYGWPLLSHEDTKPGYIDPLLIFTPAVAPASLMIYHGDVFPQFKDNLFFGGLRGTGVYRLVIDPVNPDIIISYEKLPDVNLGRIRVITESPDGMIYFATSNRDGRGTPDSLDDRILRLVPTH